MRTGNFLSQSQDEYATTVRPRSIRRSLLSAFYGALLGTAPLLISIVMRPTHRSPYLLAYPAVILAAWVWGLPASVACAAVSGFLIEYFIFATGKVNLEPSSRGWIFREFIFLAGSLMVGVLTRTAAHQRQRAAIAALNQKLLLVQAEATVAREKTRATELAIENDARSQLALDGANVGVWELDVEAGTSRWSDGYYRLHGLQPGTPPEEELRRSCCHPDDFDRVESAVRKAVAECGSFHEEYRALLPSGELRWVSCQGTAIPGPDGRATRVSGFGGDVTRRKLADLALLQNEKMAVAGRLIATIAHEINNPLDAAMNILYLIRNGVSQPEQAALLEEASLQLERISQISRHTLNFSRPSVRTTLVRPFTLVDETVRLLGPKLRLAQITLVPEVRADSEFYCDRREALQILTNILNNAIEATPGPGRIRVRISNSVEWRSRTYPGIRITVADTGSGMPADVLRRVAEPFFTTKQEIGSGIGMWVARELVQKQNGTISIRSSNARSHSGTVVSLFIPFAVEPVAVNSTRAQLAL